MSLKLQRCCHGCPMFSSIEVPQFLFWNRSTDTLCKFQPWQVKLAVGGKGERLCGKGREKPQGSLVDFVESWLYLAQGKLWEWDVTTVAAIRLWLYAEISAHCCWAWSALPLVSTAKDLILRHLLIIHLKYLTCFQIMSLFKYTCWSFSCFPLNTRT